VAGIITPWNYPFFLAMIPTITALAAGCTVVLKPSEVTPLTGQLLEDLAEKAGLPDGVLQVIHGDGTTGAALAESEVDVISFTGSTKIGKLVAAEAAKRLTPTVLELGGNDAMVVLEDADLRQTARAAVWGGMLCAGQTCIAVERLYVVESVYDEFLMELQEAFDGVAVATEDKRDIGPIINPPQLAIIESHVRDAVEKGARVLRGGKRAETDTGIYFEPTLLVDVDHDMDLVKEETFGPVLPVVRVPDEKEALRLANDTRFGLHGSVWSKDRRRAEGFASRMKSGTVAVNDVGINFVVPTVSFGGIGDSGYGSNFGEDGIRTTYCYAKSITRARLPVATSRILGAWYPRRGLTFWKALAKTLFRW
jgi:acyl-CoA reductase-like NAD-dependent aldehyde dehydrogenase